ncbi:MAG: GntR family transcriptional regulator, partial [Chloroflexota bacterium]
YLPDATLKRKPLKDEVFDVLHESILSGQYPAGAWLRQEEISRRLGVSMTPVREALDLLVSSGLAERVAYRGVRVLRPSSPDILDSYEMRLLLEGAAAWAAAINISPMQLDSLRGLVDESGVLLRLEDLPRGRDVSRALHHAIVEASGNPLLHRIYLDVLKTFPDWMLYEHLYRRPELLEDSIRNEHREHRLIVEALAAGDPAAALQRSLEHVVQRGRELEKYLGISRQALEVRESRIRHLFPGLQVPAGNPQKEPS